MAVAVVVGLIVGRGSTSSDPLGDVPAEAVADVATNTAQVPGTAEAPAAPSATGTSAPDDATTQQPVDASTVAQAAPPVVVSPPAPAPVTPQDGRGLGLATPISSPACNGRWVVFVGSGLEPDTYPADVAQLLSQFPGADYLLTDGECSSLRQRLPDDRLIYAVYYGFYPTQAAACERRDQIGGDSYVKRLDDVTPADQLWEC